MNLMRQDFYYNGKLKKGKYNRTPERAKLMLDGVQADWSKNLMTMEECQKTFGSFDPNNAVEVTRVSDHELLITTTGGHKLRFLNVEVK